MRSATAVGLAISADAHSGYVLRDRFARDFGVWREADHGREAAFDLVFPRGLELPVQGAARPVARRAILPARAQHRSLPLC